MPSGTDKCSGSYVPWLFGGMGSHTSFSGSATYARVQLVEQLIGRGTFAAVPMKSAWTSLPSICDQSRSGVLRAMALAASDSASPGEPQDRLALP